MSSGDFLSIPTNRFQDQISSLEEHARQGDRTPVEEARMQKETDRIKQDPDTPEKVKELYEKYEKACTDPGMDSPEAKTIREEFKNTTECNGYKLIKPGTLDDMSTVPHLAMDQAAIEVGQGGEEVSDLKNAYNRAADDLKQAEERLQGDPDNKLLIREKIKARKNKEALMDQICEKGLKLKLDDQGEKITGFEDCNDRNYFIPPDSRLNISKQSGNNTKTAQMEVMVKEYDKKTGEAKWVRITVTVYGEGWHTEDQIRNQMMSAIPKVVSIARGVTMGLSKKIVTVYKGSGDSGMIIAPGTFQTHKTVDQLEKRLKSLAARRIRILNGIEWITRKDPKTVAEVEQSMYELAYIVKAFGGNSSQYLKELKENYAMKRGRGDPAPEPAPEPPPTPGPTPEVTVESVSNDPHPPPEPLRRVRSNSSPSENRGTSNSNRNRTHSDSGRSTGLPNSSTTRTSITPTSNISSPSSKVETHVPRLRSDSFEEPLNRGGSSTRNTNISPLSPREEENDPVGSSISSRSNSINEEEPSLRGIRTLSDLHRNESSNLTLNEVKQALQEDLNSIHPILKDNIENLSSVQRNDIKESVAELSNFITESDSQELFKVADSDSDAELITKFQHMYRYAQREGAKGNELLETILNKAGERYQRLNDQSKMGFKDQFPLDDNDTVSIDKLNQMQLPVLVQYEWLSDYLSKVDDSSVNKSKLEELHKEIKRVRFQRECFAKTFPEQEKNLGFELDEDSLFAKELRETDVKSRLEGLTSEQLSWLEGSLGDLRNRLSDIKLAKPLIDNSTPFGSNIEKFGSIVKELKEKFKVEVQPEKVNESEEENPVRSTGSRNDIPISGDSQLGVQESTQHYVEIPRYNDSTKTKQTPQNLVEETLGTEDQSKIVHPDSGVGDGLNISPEEQKILDELAKKEESEKEFFQGTEDEVLERAGELVEEGNKKRNSKQLVREMMKENKEDLAKHGDGSLHKISPETPPKYDDDQLLDDFMQEQRIPSNKNDDTKVEEIDELKELKIDDSEMDQSDTETSNTQSEPKTTEPKDKLNKPIEQSTESQKPELPKKGVEKKESTPFVSTPSKTHPKRPNPSPPSKPPSNLGDKNQSSSQVAKEAPNTKVAQDIKFLLSNQHPLGRIACNVFKETNPEKIRKRLGGEIALLRQGVENSSQEDKVLIHNALSYFHLIEKDNTKKGFIVQFIQAYLSNIG